MQLSIQAHLAANLRKFRSDTSIIQDGVICSANHASSTPSSALITSAALAVNGTATPSASFFIFCCEEALGQATRQFYRPADGASQLQLAIE